MLALSKVQLAMVLLYVSFWNVIAANAATEELHVILLSEAFCARTRNASHVLSST